jgi:hypothetical protein
LIFVAGASDRAGGHIQRHGPVGMRFQPTQDCKPVPVAVNGCDVAAPSPPLKPPCSAGKGPGRYVSSGAG